MTSITLHIKNMVCNRCIKVVKDEFEKLDVEIEAIELGKVSIASQLNDSMLSNVNDVLDKNGFNPYYESIVVFCIYLIRLFL